MDQQEWQGYVQKIATCDYPIPMHLINNYEDWKCRSSVGRMLLILNDIEGAMAVLATVRDVKPNLEELPEVGMSEAEHKVLCLRDLAKIIWMLTGTGEAPLFYLKEANEICRAYKNNFMCVDRGAIWVQRLEILRSCGQVSKAIEEAHAEILAQADKEKINPYRFHALKFLAECLAAEEKHAQAALVLRDAYQSFPVTPAAERDLADAESAETASERYAKLLHCTTIQYQPWERGEVPTLDDVRRLQERNFQRREALKREKSSTQEMRELVEKFK